MDLQQRRQAEFEKYRKVYRDYPRYRNRQLRIDLTREWMESHIQENERDPSDTLLDVGAGRGEVLEMAFDCAVKPRGCDVVEDLCGWQSDGWFVDDLRPAGICFLPYPTATFDLVTCTDVMEHILEEDVPAALSELARVARGPVLLTICHEPDRPGKYGPDTLHVTVKGRPWWEHQIRENMDPVAVRVLYADRVNQRGTWYEVLCG